MNSKQTRTLSLVFTTPIPAGIEWAAIESLFLAAGCALIEGSGSRVRFACRGVIASFHRPHPAKEAKRYQVPRRAGVFGEDRGYAMNTLSYDKYSARVEYDAEDRIFAGRVAGINDVVGFHGESVEELERAFREAVDDYVDACAKAGKTPERPYSGRVMFRIDPRTHARAALAAELRGVSLNEWAEDAISRQAAADLASATTPGRSPGAFPIR